MRAFLWMPLGAVLFTGTVLYAQDLIHLYADTLTLPATTGSTIGVIDQDGRQLLHTYAGPDTDGLNTFLGRDAGNFTMGTEDPLYPWHGSYNTGIGRAALMANTIGFDNVAVGESALKANTEGTLNTGLGTGALPFNMVGSFNTAAGGFTLWNNVDGNGNTVLGYAAGYTETPAYANVSGSQNVWIGMEAGPGTATQLSNSIAIGYRSHATASNEVVLGNDAITATRLYGALSVTAGGATKTGVTVSGSSCIITEITSGVITGATCTP